MTASSTCKLSIYGIICMAKKNAQSFDWAFSL